MKTKLFVIVLMAGLLILGTHLGIQAHSDPAPSRPTFVHLEDLADSPSMRNREICEGEAKAFQEYGETGWDVRCNASTGSLRLVYRSSLVGQPRSGYGAYADLAFPHRIIRYSLWVYDKPSEAAEARLRWQKIVAGDAYNKPYKVDEQPSAFLVKAKDEFGFPSWARVAQEGNRLAVVKVKALAPRPTLEELEQSIEQEMEKYKTTKEEAAKAFWETFLKDLQPENEEATRVFFEDVSRSIEQNFLKTQ
jgi:hypothetical protein